jgi:hypothetical protein
MHRAAIVIAALTLSASPAHAQLTRTFIASTGNDANTCARTAPCRTLAGGYARTNAGGEINILDAAGYGALTIDKSISVIGTGTAGVLVPSGADGITINAGANGVVNLRGLIIEGTGVGSSGIVLISAKSLTIENCVIRNLVNHGLAIIPTTTSTIAVSDTYLANNGALGIVIQPTGAGSAKTVINRVEVYRSGDHGIGVFGNLTTGSVVATIVDSVSAHNAANGFFVSGNENLGGAIISIIRSIATFNTGKGVEATIGTGQFIIAQSTMTLNSSGPWAGSGGSYGDNYLDGAAGPPNIFPKG